MDTKNTILGIFFIAAGMIILFMQSKSMEETQMQTSMAEVQGASGVENESISVGNTGAAEEVNGFNEVFEVADTNKELANELDSEVLKESTVYSISNEYLEVKLTDAGAAIEEISFLKAKRGELDSFVFNKHGQVPSLALSFEKSGRLKLLNVSYAVERHTEDQIVFMYQSEDGLVVRRSFALNKSSSEPYLIKHTSAIRNDSEQDLIFKNLYLNLGTVFPINEKELEHFLTVGTFDGNKTKFTPINKVKDSRALSANNFGDLDNGLIQEGRFDWVSIQNQYYAGLLSSSIPAKRVQVLPVYDENEQGLGISSNVAFSFDTIASNESRSLETEFYVGPKEFKRLQGLGNYQDKVMQFGWFGFFSKLLLYFMSLIHSFVPNWGWSIVIMTIIIKLIFWPLTGKAAESQKGMAKIQAPMAELKKKYEKNPQKLQQETMKLFREHGVNPLAGCFPVLIQMPIFLGLFYMLRTAAELRYESFLWVADLSQADTIAVVAGFPINLFPILMGVTMFYQMQIMPVSPTADPLHTKIFKFMPFIFLIFLYNFSSGLVIYWTTQNILTIIQQKMIHSKKEPIKVDENRVQNAQSIKAKVSSLKKKSRN
ncbi:MAG: membrane protein insertase YidC [Coraliomargaritaceae bacterium]